MIDIITICCGETVVCNFLKGAICAFIRELIEEKRQEVKGERDVSGIQHRPLAEHVPGMLWFSALTPRPPGRIIRSFF